jgi:mannosyltransferase
MQVETVESGSRVQVRAAAALDRRWWLAVGLVSLLGLSLRLYGLTSYGIWFDEAYHVQLVKLPTIAAMIDAVLSNPPSDPLYVLLLRAWTNLFGTGDAAIRCLSAILSTLTVPAAFLLGRVVCTSTAGLVAGLFFAVSPYAVELGQEAALYSLAALTTTLALAAGLHWRATGSGAGLFVLAGIVAIYSHYVVAAILLLVTLFALPQVAGPRAISNARWLQINLLIWLAWLPWLALLVVHWVGSPVPRASLDHPATFEEIGNALVQFTSGTAVLHQSRTLATVLGLCFGGLLLVLGLVAGRLAQYRGLWLISAVSGVIFLLPAAVSALTGAWLFVSHFMLFLLPALFVVLGAGATMHLFREAPSPAAALPLTVIATVAVVWLGVQAYGVYMFNRYPPHGADGLRELSALLNSENVTGAPVLVTPPALMPTLQQYYAGDVRGLPEDFNLKSVYLPYDDDDWYRRSLRVVDDIGEGREEFWLVYRPELDGRGRLLNTLESLYKVAPVRRFEYADLYRFESR